ncbi:MAG: response regulator transcription factor [Muribaculaceae bacterium]|nr:response regulator transcription factor [Muribaculaceae bacterium]
MKHLKVLIITPSKIIESGLTVLLSSIKEHGVSVISSDADNATRIAAEHHPALIFADAIAVSKALADELRNESQHSKLIGVYSAAIPEEITARFDDMMSIYSGIDSIKSIVNRVCEQKHVPDENTRELSPREKEVVVGIVKGMSNKEIAAKINVSVNTVMTHRRNIVSKLQIHSPAGLTIYAIVSKIVKIEDIKI